MEWRCMLCGGPSPCLTHTFTIPSGADLPSYLSQATAERIADALLDRWDIGEWLTAAVGFIPATKPDIVEAILAAAAQR